MSEVVQLAFGAWYGQLITLYQKKEFAEALEIANREYHQYPLMQPLIYHFRACMNGCLGNGQEALRLLTEAHEAGYWYTAPYWEDADFTCIHDDPAFKQLRERSEARAVEKQAESKPDITIIEPDQPAPRPTLIALHGNNGNMLSESEQWQSLAAQGWLLGRAQSSQIMGPDSYVWNDTGIADTEIKQHYTTLIEQHGGDSSRVVLGGFSMGGETGLRQACTGLLPARGFIAIGPGGPMTNQRLDEWEPVLKQGKERGVRGCIIVGQQDGGYEGITGLIKLIEMAGIPLQVREYADIGHVYPDDFTALLPDMLKFVLGE